MVEKKNYTYLFFLSEEFLDIRMMLPKLNYKNFSKWKLK